MGRQEKDVAIWPKLKRKKLHPECIYGEDQIIIAKGCLSSEESTSFISRAEAVGFQSQRSLGAAYGEAYRDNDRISFDDPSLAEQLYTQTGLDNIMSKIRVNGRSAVGLNSNIRIYRYGKGQRFGKHIDESVDTKCNGKTEFTLLIYLSSCTGGETVFYDHRGRRVATVSPSPGLALIHRHGENECLEHEGALVSSGLKYVLRSDVVFSK